MAHGPAPLLELELVPLLLVDGRVATSLELMLEGATGVEIAVEPLGLVDRAMLVALEVDAGPASPVAPAWELHDEVPVVPGADGFSLAIALNTSACCLRLVARLVGEPDAASPARALVRARWRIVGNGGVEARAGVRVNGRRYPLEPWRHLDAAAPPDATAAPAGLPPVALGGALAAALRRGSPVGGS